MTEDATLTPSAPASLSPRPKTTATSREAPAAVAPAVGFDDLLSEAQVLLNDFRTTEIVFENRTGAPLRVYGCHVAEGVLDSDLPDEIPAWSGDGQHAVQDAMRLTVSGRGAGASGVIVLTQEDPAEIGATNVLVLFWSNPNGAQGGDKGARGVLLETGSTPAWPLRDPATDRARSPEEVCAAFWSTRAVDPTTGQISTSTWERLTRPAPFGPARRVVAARWSGDGRGTALVYLTRSRVAAAEAVGLIS